MLDIIIPSSKTFRYAKRQGINTAKLCSNEHLGETRGPLGGYLDVSKIRGGPPKWMVKIMENPIKIHDLGVPLFLETPTWMISSIISHKNHWVISHFVNDVNGDCKWLHIIWFLNNDPKFLLHTNNTALLKVLQCHLGYSIPSIPTIQHFSNTNHLQSTPLKTNMDTQNDGLEKVTPVKTGNSWYLC